MPAVFAYITAGSRDEALTIGRALVEERLAACANVLQPMTSVYRWQGRIEEAQEAVLIAKTRSERFEQLIDRVRELHSYECPCIVSLPIENGFHEYLTWIADQVD